MKAKTYSALQKTYDQSYLTCSTAVYYESQGNEAEALRCWRECLFQLQSYNSYSHRARSDTEKALLRSLKSMKDRCEKQADFLQAVVASRREAEGTAAGRSKPKNGDNNLNIGSLRDGAGRMDGPSSASSNIPGSSNSGAASPPPLPNRTKSSPVIGSRPSPWPHSLGSFQGPPPSLTLPYALTSNTSRTPSPDKRTSFLTTLRPARKPKQRSELPDTMRNRGPAAAAKAATLAWDSTNRSRGESPPQGLPLSVSADNLTTRQDMSLPASVGLHRRSVSQSNRELETPGDAATRQPKRPGRSQSRPLSSIFSLESPDDPFADDAPPPPPPHRHRVTRKDPSSNSALAGGQGQDSFAESSRKTTRRSPTSHMAPMRKEKSERQAEMRTPIDKGSRSPASSPRTASLKSANSDSRKGHDPVAEALSDDESVYSEEDSAEREWEERIEKAFKTIGKGVDASALRQVANEIVVKGDEVCWEDVAGLDMAKLALKEAVVYPFLRPDLFSGLREPARGMMLFGPPGTGKTMLARAVATESKSTFFSISASSLTSKYLGESEKLVRALFALAKALAPSIIFVDEIDSLLSSRSGGGEHEATRRLKTEFLIQWSDLARAAAGKESNVIGDPSRVLVLAATNLPWAIDEAARRRFVRRQYIPLPENQTRERQIGNLLGYQKHGLSEVDMARLVELTDGFSGSDITALAKDAAMGPLRSLGEALLHMRMDQIRPIGMEDFECSLKSIRPSVSKESLQAFDDWAKQYGERVG